MKKFSPTRMINDSPKFLLLLINDLHVNAFIDNLDSYL